jgi:inosose dehydratase
MMAFRFQDKTTRHMKTDTIEMSRQYTRRTFCKAVGLGVGAAILPLPGIHATETPKRRLQIGHTGITWGYNANNAAQAIKELGSLGYAGYETFGEYFPSLDAKGGIQPLLDEAKLPLVSAYCNVNLTDATKRQAEVDKIVGWGKSIQKAGGAVAVIGPNQVPRGSYDFNAHKADIIATLDDMCRALSDIGMIGALHQHTGTCVEKHDEVYAVMEGVDTKYVKFGPDVGQLAKGGSDPVKIVGDFLEIVEHVHLKDWDGGKFWAAYCPLGQGKVAIPEVLDLLEKSKIKKMIMVELDWDAKAPMAPIETAKVAKAYLENQGYTFRI